MTDIVEAADPVDGPEPALPPDATVATFHCATCGAFALRTWATEASDPRLGLSFNSGITAPRVVAEHGGGTFVIALSERAAPDPIGAIRDAIAAADPADIGRLGGRDAVPLWCPPCDAVYCWDHWLSEPCYDEGFFDEMRGTCPAGHELMLWD